MADLLYSDLTYKIIGILFKVHNELGSGYQEKYFQKAIALALNHEHLKYSEQTPVEIIFRGKKIGRYFIDFTIENKIVLEIKVTPRFYPRDIKQILAYLKQTNLEIGILASFTKDGVLIKRLTKGRK